MKARNIKQKPKTYQTKAKHITRTQNKCKESQKYQTKLKNIKRKPKISNETRKYLTKAKIIKGEQNISNESQKRWRYQWPRTSCRPRLRDSLPNESQKKSKR
jgi:hypothetical protein